MRIVLLALALLGTFISYAQQLDRHALLGSGGYSTRQGFSVSYSMGESFAGTYNTNPQVQAGNQQVYSPVVIAALEAPAENSLQVYPNPSADAFFVQSEGILKVIISDAKGCVIRELEGDFAEVIRIDHLPTGVFQLTIRTKDGRSIQTIVKN